MKKSIATVLAALTIASTLTACAPAQDQLDPAITLASSAARAKAEWLDDRLETIPDDVVIGIGSNEAYGIDMSEFEEDGYILRTIDGQTMIFGASEDGLDRAVREYAKAADVGATAELDTVYHEGERIKKLTIANRDISEYTIVYKYDREYKNPSSQLPTFGNTQYAAEELARLLEKATGIEFIPEPISDSTTGPVISIDYYEGDDLGENGFTYKVENGNIYINGVGAANGCANAVYYLLEHECGWDALIYGDSDLQSAESVNIPNGVEKRIKPMFEMISLNQVYVDGFKNDKSAFSRSYYGTVGTANHMIGEWSGTGGNICPTDEGMYLQISDRVWNHINSNVNAKKKIGEDFIEIDLGMADATDLCKCKSCTRVLSEENNALSGAQIRMANRLAEDMEAEGFGGLRYTVFAYAGANAPCVTKPRDNVYITYCPNGSCVNHLVDGSECWAMDSHDAMGNIIRKTDPGNEEYKYLNNADFYKWMQGWGEISNNVCLYIYYLPGNFSQYAYFSDIYEDMHAIYEAGITGYYPEAQYLGLGLNRLRYQLMMDIIWHPEMTKDEYEVRVDEHMRREYGDGYTYVRDFIDIWASTEANTGCWTSWLYYRILFTHTFDMDMYAERAPEMYELLEKAMKLCNTTAQEVRIKRLMVDVLYKECYSQYFKAYDAGDTDKIEYLEGRYDLFVDHMTYCGYDFNKLPATWSFGPAAYQTIWSSKSKTLNNNLEDAAWIEWAQWRDGLSAEGAEQKPMPEKYVEYWETAKTEE